MSYIVTQLLGKDKSSDLKTHFYPYINDAFSVALADFSKLKWNLYEPDNQNHKSDLLRIKKIVYRNCFVTLVNTNKTGFFFLRNDLLDESDWKSVVKALENVSNLKPDFDPFSQAYKTFYTQYTDFYHNFKDRNHWHAEKTGQIILSDQPGQSYYFDNHGEIKRYANGSDIEDATNITLEAIKTKLSSWIDGPIEDNQDDNNVLEV